MKLKYFVDLTPEDRHLAEAEGDIMFHKIGKPSKRVSSLSLLSASILVDSIVQHIELPVTKVENGEIGYVLFFVPDSIISLCVASSVIDKLELKEFRIMIDSNNELGELRDVTQFFTRKEVMKGKVGEISTEVKWIKN